MKITVLGCGTSTGVPVIGCDCGVCTSSDGRNRRSRSSIIVHAPGGNILVDTSTDLRSQVLRESILRIDAVLYTHPHADHIHGIDELRGFNRIQNEEPIPVYADPPTIERIKTNFRYIFAEDGYTTTCGWKPNLTAEAITGPTDICGVKVTPIEIEHGRNTILAFRFGGAAYLTDCSAIPEESMELLKGVDVIIIGALRRSPHPSHFSIDQAVEAGKSAGASRIILTHMGHAVDYTELTPRLAGTAELAYDGMTIEF